MDNSINDYTEYLKKKNGSITHEVTASAEDATQVQLNASLFKFQSAIVRWALQRRCAAIFADTGLGKSRMELAFADAVVAIEGPDTCKVMIFTPLCTTQQLVDEAAKMGLASQVKAVRSMDQVSGASIYVANYEIADKFDMSHFKCVVLDESSILKHKECKTGQWLISKSQQAPYRLCLTATPCPNDYAEIMNQAAFLGVATHDYLLNTFFQRIDNTKVRMRPHAMKPFATWLSTWSVWVSSPADLGFHDEAAMYELPKLSIEYEVVEIPADRVQEAIAATEDAAPTETGTKKPKKKGAVMGGFENRIKCRRMTLEDRIKACAAMVNADDSPWVVWCTLNDESHELAKLIQGAVELTGADPQAKKDAALRAFASGEKRVLVTKSEIAGFGLNWQHCHNMVFVSFTDSYESMYQAIRRCYRFGQTREVKVKIITTSVEKAVQDNIARKDREVSAIKTLMMRHMHAHWTDAGPRGAAAKPEAACQGICESRIVETGNARMIQGDCVAAMAEHMGEASVDYIVFSPPFQSLYRYSPDVCDVSNCANESQFEEHMRFVAKQLLRVLKPGRLMSFHCMNIPRRRLEHGDACANSIIDLRGQLVRIFEAAGFLLQSEVCVFRDPVQAMYRTKAQGLFYKTFCGDASIARQALPDYVITMRKPGSNAVPIVHAAGPSNPMEKWIKLASPVWHVNHSNTLNVKKSVATAACGAGDFGSTQGDSSTDDAGAPASPDDCEIETEDQKHPTPLQLEVIENCVDLWTNEGEIVLDPFSGIGSVGHVCKRLGRKYVGIELVDKYFEASLLHV